MLMFCGFAVIMGLLHSAFEGHHPVEGLWWALVTLTTVGYGDISSVTAGGRITGALLMIAGIGTLAFITANVAAYFVEGDYKKELREEIQSLHRRLDHLEELLSSQATSREGPDPND